jgi:2-dehydropantoate 2-reductase
MNFLIYGAGAIGGYVGGMLARGGNTVAFIARPTQAAFINEHGLTLENAPGQTEPQIIRNLKAYGSPTEALAAGQYDCLILALKAFDTEGAIADLKAANVPTPPILCLQNGVDNEPKLAEAFGAQQIIAGTILTAVATPEPGRVMIEKNRGAGIGGGHPLSERLGSVFNAAGISTRVYPNPEAMKWTKLIANLMGNALSAICDVSTSEVFASDTLYAIEIGQLKEALAVMQAKGLKPVALPKSPTLWLVFALSYLPPWSYRAIFQRALGGARGSKRPSLHMDLSAGKGRSEVGYLNGAVARHAREVGVKAPINAALTEILEGIVTGRIPWAEYRGKPEKLAKRIFGS